MRAWEVGLICFMNHRRGCNSREIRAEVSCTALALHVEINGLSLEGLPLTQLAHRELNSRATRAHSEFLNKCSSWLVGGPDSHQRAPAWLELGGLRGWGAAAFLGRRS